MAQRLPASETDLQRGIDRVLVPRERIAARVRELARQLADEYEGAELTIIAVLTGSLIFLADLVRSMPLMMRLDVVSVSSYPGASVRSQGPQLRLAPAVDLAGRDVLIVDDILDSGQTLRLLVEAIERQNPASLRTCVLLRKLRPDITDRVEADWAGFDVPDEFVIGYGLDHDHLYRNLPDICVLKDAPQPSGEEGPS